MLRFKDGLLLTTFMPDPSPGVGGGGGTAPPGGGPSSPPPGVAPNGGTPPAGAPASGNGGAPNGGSQPWSFPTDKPFAEYLPERLRADPSFRDIKSFDGLAESFVNVQRMVGADKATIFQLPKEDDAKGWDSFFNRLGRPEKADGYKIPKRADGKDYDPVSQNFHKAIMPALHEAGLSQKQIERIVPKWNDIFDNAAKAQADADAADKSKSETALKGEWGAAYADKLTLAQSAINHYAGELNLTDTVLAELDATKLGNTPGLAKLFAHLGAQLKEDGLVGKGDSNFASALSPAEAQQQIAAMNADETQTKALLDPRHPQHKAVMEKRTRLFEQAYPQAAA